MVRYRLIKQVGEGSLAIVYKGEVEGIEGYVAVKKLVRTTSAENTFSMVRELVAMRRLEHDNVIKMLDVWTESATVAMVLEYMPYDISGLVGSSYRFSEEQVMSLMYQMIDGICFLHSKGMIHRDIKSSNLLLDTEGRLKIADFGLSRDYANRMSSGVSTLWYRAPELLLGDAEYTDNVDTWSVACVVLEMKFGRPFFRGGSELSQVTEILRKLGCPYDAHPWSGFLCLEKFKREDPWENIINGLFGNHFCVEMRQLLSGMLQVDKNKRISLTEVFRSPFIQAVAGKLVPIKHEECHEFEVERKCPR